MALLTNEQILQILQDGNKPEELETCREHDIRARFHTQGKIKGRNYSQEYRKDFLEFVGRIINHQKLQVFEHLLTAPVETVEFTEGVFDELTKIFEAQDRYIGYEFTNPELTGDFDTYRQEIGDHLFWQTKGFNLMKTAINSVVILDLPTEQDVRDRFPRPYYYMLDVQKVKACDVGSMYKMEYIVFENKYDDKTIHAFDDMFFRTYRRDKGNKWFLSNEVPHDLGYTPARSFWTTPFEDHSKLQKRGPHSNSLGKLDWLLFLSTSTKHVELYAGFPIDVMYETQCTYMDASGNRCEGGKVKCSVSDGVGGFVAKYDDCPTCKNKSMLGAGTVLTAPARATNDDPDLLAGMNRIPADTDSLKYLMDRIESYEATISTNMIGYIPESIRQAMNKDQVGSQIESQMNCLAEVRDNFQDIHRFVLETLARLRYGANALLSITVNYGNKWFIHSVEKLQEQFKSSKENGFANFELSQQFEQLLLTKYKNNPSQLERARTLTAIEPYQNYTIGELLTMSDKFGLNKDFVRLKLDFNNYVNRFEREFMDIGVFMQFMPFNTKVAFIQEKLLGYVKEDYPEELPKPPVAPPVPPTLPPAA